MNKETYLRRALLKIENPYPKDDLITSYQDFALVRKELKYYKFNVNVCNSILKLVLDLWDSKKRINLYALVYEAQNYRPEDNTQQNENSNLNEQSRKLIFDILKKSIAHPIPNHKYSPDIYACICCLLTICTNYTEYELNWICSNIQKSPDLLKFILEYPVKSRVISDWAFKNINNDVYVGKRIILASRIKDFEQEYTITVQDIMDDVRCFNNSEFRHHFLALRNKESEYKVSQRSYGVPFINYNSMITNSTGTEQFVHLIDNEALMFDNEGNFNLPLSAKVHTDYFFNNVFISYCYANLKVISLSRLESSIKNDLIKKYYCPELFKTFARICVKNKLNESLHWLQGNKLLNKPDAENIKLPENFDSQKNEIQKERETLELVIKGVVDFEFFK